MTRKQMPDIDLKQADLTDEELALANEIVNRHTGKLRVSKPTVTTTDLGPDPEDEHGYYRLYHIEGGETAYIWRMVAFMVSPRSVHHCIPCTASFDVPGCSGPEKQQRLDELDAIADKIAATVPLAQCAGALRWGRALGML